MCTSPGGKRIKGFTLIELLVSLVLLSLVLTMASFSLFQYSSYGDRIGRNGDKLISQLLVLERLKLVLSKTENYYVGNFTGNTIPFFSGKETVAMFVSGSSIESNDDQIVARLKVVDEEDDTVSLIMQQMSLNGRALINLADVPDEFEEQKMLLQGAKSITFSYLGADNIRQIYPTGVEQNFLSNLKWQDNYDAAQTLFFPKKMRIDVVLSDGSEWPCIFEFKIQNEGKRGLMLDGQN